MKKENPSSKPLIDGKQHVHLLYIYVMHVTLHNSLSKDTFLLQFYGWIVRGLLSDVDRKAIYILINKNIERLQLMQDDLKWDGRYDLVIDQQAETQRFVSEAKKKLEFKQICDDKDISDYINNNPDFTVKGIILNDLRHLVNVDKALKRGHLLHDVYHGYPEHFYLFQVDCMDYMHSAAHFYNEGYDYYYQRKTIKNYSEIDINSIHWTEQKRIQPSDEVSFRNFREAHINLIFFVESFLNSVGYHAYLSGAGKNVDEENQLRGIESITRKGFKNYSNLKQRISNISRIVGGQALDCDQEPFSTYLQTSVELRNQYVHSSVDKPKIYQTLENWKEKCDKMIDTECMGLIRKFWQACYPTQPFPIIIANAFDGNSFKGRPGKFYAEQD
ncbi:hypothetical protein FMM05_00260 [Flavobacterium zepuense]|uniref:Apea-like HEPN domain-containing protein n=1 Tax=Flavobacterium zepuense TaxID=2593302 RepID=A0A552V9K0_9FLAO|nr:hypothetical protein [Flavobacterium zepuense]TRW27119.1 hypothetical protein FMM05_00260 [Flavobacterium zepuense]